MHKLIRGSAMVFTSLLNVAWSPPAAAAELPPSYPSRGHQEQPTQPEASRENGNATDQSEQPRVQFVVLRPGPDGSDAAAGAGGKKGKDGNRDEDRFWSGDIPWIIAALIAFAGGFTALLTSLNGLLTARSAHGAVRGFLRIDDVVVLHSGGAETLAFRAVNIGKEDLRGVRFVGWLVDGGGRKWRVDGPSSIQQMKSSMVVSVRCTARKIGAANRLRWLRCRVGKAGIIAIYTDHADVVRKEMRTFGVTGGSLVQRRWRTRRAYYSIG